MKMATALAIFSLPCFCMATARAAPVTFDWATIGNPGNAGDVQSQGTFGSVAYTYRISKTEVTNAQYTTFLNAVDPTAANSLSLFNTNMANNFGGIENTGIADGSRYIAQAGREDNPVTYVSWYDSVRFINWLHNGQGSGGTESGAYTLNGGTATPSNGLSVIRDTNAIDWLPSENEWYKAAYHDASSGLEATYFIYATGGNAEPVSDQPGDNQAAVNYFNDDREANGFNDGYVASGTSDLPLNTSPFTDVGACTDATSPYGTFDQSGNVAEWVETFIGGPFRGIRGGNWSLNFNILLASSRVSIVPTLEGAATGFRVATIPEQAPSLVTLTTMVMSMALTFFAGNGTDSARQTSPIGKHTLAPQLNWRQHQPVCRNPRPV